MWSFYPMMFLVLLMVWVWWRTAFTRIGGAVKGKLAIEAIIYGNQHELPKPYILPGRNYDNLMQQPVMFMLLMLMMFQLNIDHPIVIGLAWLFVVGRYWHSFEHLTARNVRRRTVAFASSSISHWLLWFWLFSSVVLAN